MVPNSLVAMLADKVAILEGGAVGSGRIPGDLQTALDIFKP